MTTVENQRVAIPYTPGPWAYEPTNSTTNGPHWTPHAPLPLPQSGMPLCFKPHRNLRSRP
jgi:hypothetical protein